MVSFKTISYSLALALLAAIPAIKADQEQQAHAVARSSDEELKVQIENKEEEEQKEQGEAKVQALFQDGLNDGDDSEDVEGDQKEEEGVEKRIGGDKHDNIVVLKPNGEWKKFYFGKAGTEVETKFVFHLRERATLDLTDYFCPGDAFHPYDNGVSLGRTPLKRTNGCEHKTLDPNVAFASDKWSHRSYELGKGKHVITIKVVRSPYCGGAAAIRLNPIVYLCVDSADSSSSCSSSSSSSSAPSCSSSSSSSGCPAPVSPCRQPQHEVCDKEFTVVTSKVPFCEAEGVCRALGLKLANLTNDNFLAATKDAFRCSGDFSETWIKSWYDNTYNNSCLVLSTGSTAPGGAINVPNNCNICLPVLCQRCDHKEEGCGHKWEEHCSSESSSSESCSDSEDRHRPQPPCGKSSSSDNEHRRNRWEF